MDQHWIQCVECRKWRCLPNGVNPDNLPEHWLCGMEPFNRHCEIPEAHDNSIAASDDNFVVSYRDHNMGAGTSKPKEVRPELVPPKKTKLLQKSVKDFFPKIAFDEAMEALRLNALNDNNATHGTSSATTIVNITAGRPRPVGRPRKF